MHKNMKKEKEIKHIRSRTLDANTHSALTSCINSSFCVRAVNILKCDISTLNCSSLNLFSILLMLLIVFVIFLVISGESRSKPDDGDSFEGVLIGGSKSNLNKPLDGDFLRFNNDVDIDGSAFVKKYRLLSLLIFPFIHDDFLFLFTEKYKIINLINVVDSGFIAHQLHISIHI